MKIGQKNEKKMYDDDDIFIFLFHISNSFTCFFKSTNEKEIVKVIKKIWH